MKIADIFKEIQRLKRKPGYRAPDTILFPRSRIAEMGMTETEFNEKVAGGTLRFVKDEDLPSDYDPIIGCWIEPTFAPTTFWDTMAAKQTRPAFSLDDIREAMKAIRELKTTEEYLEEMKNKHPFLRRHSPTQPQ